MGLSTSTGENNMAQSNKIIVVKHQKLFGVDLRLKDLRSQLKVSQTDKQTEKLNDEIERLVKEQSQLVNEIIKLRGSK